MKLASYRDGSRDGQLVVVSHDLSMALHASGIAGRLQQVLDDWRFLAPQLQDLSQTLDHGKARHAFPFEPAMCLAPLPRAPRWVRASAYLGVAERERQSEPLFSAAAGDLFLGPTQDVVFRGVEAGIDFEAQWAVVTGDIPAGASADQALDGVRLVGLLNDWRLCPPGRGALAPSAGAGVPDQAPAGWAPVLVTPDELGGAWRHGRLALQVEIRLNGQHHARLATDEGMPLPIGSLLAALARQRPLTAGTLLSSGAIGHDAAAAAPTPLQDGDVVRIEAFAADGQSVFGAIAQTVVGHD